MMILKHTASILYILGINIPLWLAMGYFWGIATWHASEWQYRRHLAKQGAEPGSFAL